MAPAAVVSPLQTPIVTNSFNIPDKIVNQDNNPQILTDLSTKVEDQAVRLEMVTKETEDLKDQVVTVDLPPPVYTVEKPVVKPVLKDEDESQVKTAAKVALVKEVQASEPSPSPSSTPKPSQTSTPSPTSAPVTLANSNSETMFNMVNDYRSKLGLKAFEKDERICKIAQQRAPQVNGELQSGNLHKGFKDLNLPYWATENIAAYASLKEDFNFWISDYIHKKAIESDNKYSCVACSGTSCSQIFTSFVQK